MNWQNGRKLIDEYDNIKAWYFEPDFVNQDNLTNEELAELSLKRNRLRVNQAR